MPNTNRIRMERRSVHDLTDTQIETLINFGKRRATLFDELEAATRAGDRELAWQIAQALCQIEDQVQEVKE